MARAMKHASILPLVLDGVGVEIGGQALVAEVDHRFEDGGLSVILGPNGAGKSLLLRVAHGLLAPSRGAVRWLGPKATGARHHQAMVFHRPVLLRRSVLGNVVFALRLKGMVQREAVVRAREVLQATGLSDKSELSAGALSGGEQQRLALARAWAVEPEVLFLDEPTSNLDPAASWAIETLIRSISASGTKIIMTTHDLPLVRRLADEFLFLHRGRLLVAGAAADLFAHPQTPELVAFLKGDLRW